MLRLSSSSVIAIVSMSAVLVSGCQSHVFSANQNAQADVIDGVSADTSTMPADDLDTADTSVDVLANSKAETEASANDVSNTGSANVVSAFDYNQWQWKHYSEIIKNAEKSKSSTVAE